jgi:thioredoxin reductase
VFTPVSDALVIGAGPAGLATSYQLGRAGVSHLVLERGGSVGQTWAELYDNLVLHTVRRLSSLPGLGFPAGSPLFPRRLDFLEYLRAYARAFDLPVRLGAEVVRLWRDGGAWRVRTAEGAELSSRAVVVATGIVAGPYEPELPGRSGFGGLVVHSSAYRRPQPFLGQRVLVVGAGNSAADIATELARAGIEVTIAVRGGATVVPLTIAGIPIQYVGFALAWLPIGARRALATAFGRMAALGRPSALPLAPIAECTGVPVIGRHLSDALRSGAVRLKGQVIELVPGAVRFADGETIPFETVVLATGYRAAIGFLGDSVRRNPCGFALRTDEVTSADHPGLYFVGHNPDVRGALYRIGRDARVAAQRVRSALDDRRRRTTERGQRSNER